MLEFWLYYGRDVDVLFFLISCYRSPSIMGILVADRKFLGEIGVLDEGMKVYGGENVELGIRVSKPHLAMGAWKARFNVRQSFQGLAYKVWQMNTTKAHDMTIMKTAVFSKSNNNNAV